MGHARAILALADEADAAARRARRHRARPVGARDRSAGQEAHSTPRARRTRRRPPRAGEPDVHTRAARGASCACRSAPRSTSCARARAATIEIAFTNEDELKRIYELLDGNMKPEARSRKTPAAETGLALASTSGLQTSDRRSKMQATDRDGRLRRLSEQTRRWRARSGPERHTRPHDDPDPGRLQDGGRCRCVRVGGRTGARPDGRFLHADRRRPVHLRPDRRRQRAERRLRDGRPAAAPRWPSRRFPQDGPRRRRSSAQIFRGGFDKLREAGVALLGGHTVQDPEIKFGYAVTGAVDPGADPDQRRRAGRATCCS